MNEWEMKYNALLSGIANQDHVLAAESMVRTAIDLASASVHPPGDVLHWILTVAGLLEAQNTRNLPDLAATVDSKTKMSPLPKQKAMLPRKYKSKKLRRG